MTIAVTRVFSLVTIFAYIAVGTLVYRLNTNEKKYFTFSPNYYKILKNAQFTKSKLNLIEVSTVKIPENKERPIQKLPIAKTGKKNKTKKISRIVKLENLPFEEPINLSRVEIVMNLPKNLVGFYREVPQLKLVEDQLTTKMAKSTNKTLNAQDEPVFLEYPVANVEEKEAKVKAVENSSKNVDKKVEAVDNLHNEESQDFVTEEMVAYDYSSQKTQIEELDTKAVDKVTKNVEAVEKATRNVDQNLSTVNPVLKDGVEEVPLDEMISYDYSVAKKHEEAGATSNTYVSNQIQAVAKKLHISQNKFKKKKVSVRKKPSGYSSMVAVKVTGTNLRETHSLNGFEVSFNDEDNSQDDYGTGLVQIDEKISSAKMNRSTLIRKQGYASTHFELTLENGWSEIVIPLIEDGLFKTMIEPFEIKGPVGIVLVEMDDVTEDVQIDVPAGKILKLDGNMRETQKENFRYVMFIGVHAGNAMVSYKLENEVVINKIIHVHDLETTFDANLYEEANTQVLSLYEEDLLGKEKSPLIINANQVKRFASNEYSKKISDNKYQINIQKALLGTRHYVELNHQEEPVFVGFRDAVEVEIPSENFMRHILSRFQDRKLGNRCMVQINLNQEITSVETGSESVDNGLSTYIQYLDSDGKFYDSPSSKTKKIIIVGENQGSGNFNQDAKINLKITNVNEASQYIGTYCSPNTYLVEQL